MVSKVLTIINWNLIYYLDIRSSDMAVSGIITTINTIEPTGGTVNGKY